MFKRLHQLGSKAKFVGVTWDGDTAPDYHEAVYRAFRTSEHVGSVLNKYTGLTVAAHSLGNMVISNAIENHDFDPDRYFMLNAATPIEAYSATQTSNSSGNVDMNEHLTEHDWKPYEDELFAANWYQLFPPDADEKDLTWKDRFSNVSDRAYNFYSPGEDVVQNAGSDESITAAIWQIILNTATELTLEESLAINAWTIQEIVKGGKFTPAGVLVQADGGWKFNYYPPSLAGGSTPAGYWKSNFPNILDPWRMYTPTEAAAISDADLIEVPFFNFVPDDHDFSDQDTQWHLLAESIPAMSFAAAANAVDGVQANFDMMQQTNEWPQSRLNSIRNRDWLHSDLKNISLNYVLPMYEQMITTGGLRDE